MSAETAQGDGTVRQFTVAADDDGVRLDRWFKRHLPQIGFATVSRWARTGQLRIDGKRADPADRLAAGQVLRVPPGGDAPRKTGARPRRDLTPAQIELARAMVIAETPAAFVLNKPPGLATQGGSGTHEHVDGLLDALAQDDAPRPRLVHRLDKDTSGALLIARTPGSAAYFSKHFSGRSARKIYWALVIGVPDIEEGLIELPLAKQPGTGGEKMYVDAVGGQSARTRYRVIDIAGSSAAWLELQPLTGRTHQLRVHLSAIGHPIVGDGKYGGPAAFLTGSISRKMHLHAHRLMIDAPGGGRIDVTAPLPEHFAATMAHMGFDEGEGAWTPDADPLPTKVAIKTAAKAHAKQVRKERRGERRGRGGDAAKGKPAKAQPAAGAKSRPAAGARPKTAGGPKAKPGPRSRPSPGSAPKGPR